MGQTRIGPIVLTIFPPRNFHDSSDASFFKNVFNLISFLEQQRSGIEEAKGGRGL